MNTSDRRIELLELDYQELEKRIVVLETLLQQTQPIKNKTKEEKYRDTLLAYDFNPHNKGFNYIITALIDYEAFGKLTKLYENIADKYSTLGTRVEKNIRYAKRKTQFANCSNGEMLSRIILKITKEK